LRPLAQNAVSHRRNRRFGPPGLESPKALTRLVESEIHEATLLGTISVVIPSYNMDWCIARAIRSCQTQSLRVDEIIIVDDCSTDNTEQVVYVLLQADKRIRYFKLARNSDHLAALKYGASRATSDWIALLDADDELTPHSIEARVTAAQEYKRTTGITPQFIYGDLSNVKFTFLRGYSFPYVCRELSLCQTSTMMLGRESVQYIPVKHIYHTDDEIVLAISKIFHLVHCGEAVAICHEHNSPSGRKNNPWRVFEGVCELVRAHRTEIRAEHGLLCLFFWKLRIAKTFIGCLILENRRMASPQSKVAPFRRVLLRFYRSSLIIANLPLSYCVGMYFDNVFF
jgi:glycosyltransferase involved in cell wall biosynthesis